MGAGVGVWLPTMRVRGGVTATRNDDIAGLAEDLSELRVSMRPGSLPEFRVFIHDGWHGIALHGKCTPSLLLEFDQLMHVSTPLLCR